MLVPFVPRYPIILSIYLSIDFPFVALISGSLVAGVLVAGVLVAWQLRD